MVEQDAQLSHDKTKAVWPTMFHIIASIRTLIQFNQSLNDKSVLLRPEKCSNCGKSFPALRFYPWVSLFIEHQQI